MQKTTACFIGMLINLVACGARSSFDGSSVVQEQGGEPTGLAFGSTGGASSTSNERNGFGGSSDRNATGGTAPRANATTSVSGTIGGASSSGGSPASGCSGSFEMIQSLGTGLCVTAMVSIPRPTNGVYFIDATEVTKGQYSAWLATNPSLPGSSDNVCNWNTSYAADSLCLKLDHEYVDDDHHPQVCIDWCDASAYCEAVGKRLCGAIDGGSLQSGFGANPNVSQWYRACTSGGQFKFPYGDTYQSGYCNDDTNNLAATDVVGALPRCASPSSGYAGVYDLSGNVWEFQDSCTITLPNSGSCLIQGGSFLESYGYMACNEIGVYQTFTASSFDTGFRCCSL
jgi:sulfatase modifying factor 1